MQKDNKLYLIPSAQYVNVEMQAELGRIPPALLPVRNNLLVLEQLEQVEDLPENIVLTLPESYQVDIWLQKKLNEKNIEVLHIPDSLSLGESILYTLNLLNELPEQLFIQYGDTIISNNKCKDGDYFALHQSVGHYEWGYLDRSEDLGGDSFITKLNEGLDTDKYVLSGYFAFSRPRELVKAITLAKGDFLKAINDYSQQFDMHAMQRGNWHDFGHLKTFFYSRKNFSTERAFNSLLFKQHSLQKSSEQDFKMQAEANWFSSLPCDLKLFSPQLVKVFDSGYELEYLHLCALNELFVFGDLPLARWKEILDSCSDFTEACRRYPSVDEVDIEEFYVDKTLSRLNKYLEEQGLDLNQSFTLNGEETDTLQEIVDKALNIIKGDPVADNIHLTHGDLCFSNILYDFRGQMIKVIDPRGYIKSNEPGIYGDGRYDLAKLYHSMVGFYDLIIAENYKLKELSDNEFEFEILSTEKQNDISILMHDFLVKSTHFSPEVIHAICVSLFLSMLPLHYDKPRRQKALFANALRLSMNYPEVAN